MPAPDHGMNDAFNRELERQGEYDGHELDQSVQSNVPLLNSQQKEVYYTLMLMEIVVYFSFMLLNLMLLKCSII
jgi:hypothetical protein